jgi:prepilin-type N-terminal cleavage/methylation domain-containing protein
VSKRGQSGFTLVEVMIALAILFAALTVLIRANIDSITGSHRAKMMGIAAHLARAKMYDIEEKLLAEGFQELDQGEEGDFSEEGWQDITWESKIEKVELPGLATMQAAQGGEGEEGAGGVLGGMLGGMGGGAEGDSSMAAGASVVSGSFEIIANVLEQSIRRVELTVKYQVVAQDEPEEMKVVCYFTDPAAVDKAIQLGGAPADDGGGEGGGGPPAPPDRAPPPRGPRPR